MIRYAFIDGPLTTSIKERLSVPPEVGQVRIRSILSEISTGIELAVYRGIISSLSNKRWDNGTRYLSDQAISSSALPRKPDPKSREYPLATERPMVSAGPGSLTATMFWFWDWASWADWQRNMLSGQEPGVWMSPIYRKQDAVWRKFSGIRLPWIPNPKHLKRKSSNGRTAEGWIL